MDNIAVQFEEYKKQLKCNDNAAAILTLASVIKQTMFDFDHQICMGLRMGLFGTDAGSDSSILDLKPDDLD